MQRRTSISSTSKYSTRELESFLSLVRKNENYERVVKASNTKRQKAWYEYTFEEYLHEETRRKIKQIIPSDSVLVRSCSLSQPKIYLDYAVNSTRIQSDIPTMKKNDQEYNNAALHIINLSQSLSEKLQGYQKGWRLRRKLRSNKGRELTESYRYIKTILESEEDKSSYLYKNFKKMLENPEEEFYHFIHESVPYHREFDIIAQRRSVNTTFKRKNETKKKLAERTSFTHQKKGEGIKKETPIKRKVIE